MSTPQIVETISTSFFHAVEATPEEIEILARSHMTKDFPNYHGASFEIRLLSSSQTHKGFSEYIFQVCRKSSQAHKT